MTHSPQVWTPGDDATPAPATQSRRRPWPVPVGLVALIAAVLAVDVTLVWLLVAPRVPIIRVEGGFVYAEAQPEQAVAADGWFAFLGLIAGLLLAIVAWIMLRHRRGAAVLVALVLGSLVGAWLGWWLGTQVELAHFDAVVAATPVGGHLEAPLSLRVTDLDRDQWWVPKATGVVVAQALAAALVYTTLAGFATDPDLRANPPEPEDDPRARPEVFVRPSPPAVRPDQAEPALSSDPDGPSGPPDSPARPGAA